VYDYFVIYKPYRVLSQFTTQEGKQTLKDFFTLPKDVYPVGRLDFDSEGLLILSNDKELNHRLLHPAFEHEREYLVQVEGEIEKSAIDKLEEGVIIAIDGKKYYTKPCKAKKISASPLVPERNPPIRHRKNIPSSWISLTLTEGKNRQVRKMTASVGLPTLRLIRLRIGSISIHGWSPGDMVQMDKHSIYLNLFAEPSL
jgi:23S rRNA pseudouridine2457 synthase